MSMSNTTKRVKEIRRKTRRKFSSEEKIRIVLDGLRGESSIAELCRQEGINANLYYRWSKDFLEAGKKRLSGDTLWKFMSFNLSASNSLSGYFLISLPEPAIPCHMITGFVYCLLNAD